MAALHIPKRKMVRMEVVEEVGVEARLVLTVVVADLLILLLLSA